MKICICIPSRGRPEFLERLVKTAFNNAKDPASVIVKYYLNDDDEHLDQYVKILDMLKKTYNVKYDIGPDQNTVLSWNMIAESEDAEYYMLAGDEIQFKTKEWEQKIFDTRKKYPDGVYCISTNDGRPNRVSLQKCVQPIVTKEWAKALGFHWSPMFWHWQVDMYTGLLAKSINRFIFLDKVIIEMKKMKDTTGLRNRKKGVFRRDEYVLDKLQKIYFEFDKQRLLGACK